MTVCLPEKDYVTRGWHNLSKGDKPSNLILTRFIIVLLHRISSIVKLSIDLLNMGHHLVSVVRYELDQIIMALCRIFDVIKQL
jgi:hypothetical protein